MIKLLEKYTFNTKNSRLTNSNIFSIFLINPAGTNKKLKEEEGEEQKEEIIDLIYYNYCMFIEENKHIINVKDKLQYFLEYYFDKIDYIFLFSDIEHRFNNALSASRSFFIDDYPIVSYVEMLHALLDIWETAGDFKYSLILDSVLENYLHTV